MDVAQHDRKVIDLTSDLDQSDDNGDDDSDMFFDAAMDAQLPLDNRVNGNVSPLARPPTPAALQNAAAIQRPAAVPQPGALYGGSVWGDYIIDDDFDDGMIAPAMETKFGGHLQPQRGEDSGTRSSIATGMQAAQPVETRLICVDTVLSMFPGICRDHVSHLCDTVSQQSERVIAHILDQMEKGAQYPKAKDKPKPLKRKREAEEDEEAARKYTAVDRRAPLPKSDTAVFIRKILSNEFPETPMAFIDATLNQSGHRLFSAYRVLEEAHRTFDPRHPPYNKIKRRRVVDDSYAEDNIESSMVEKTPQASRVEILHELRAARKTRRRADAKREAEHQAELDEEINLVNAKEEGTMQECGCCFGDYPLNRMVHCDGEELHWFCSNCARMNAETEIGNSKYELKCMSMDQCDSGFSIDQRSQFLDEKTIVALERNEQEAVLRLAGIENLASCPFCPFAAEYPPVEVDWEFKCQAPDCEKVSCRLCKLESHIPKSCEENAKDNGLSIRRQIEEAMSAAMIRKCNKCGTPFVKEEGCNKMTCTRNGCYNVQCYVCSKSCSYDHFDDRNRGGKEGNCPLFENAETRHDQEVNEAEKAALEKVRAEHPEYTEEDLKVKMSDNVKQDDEKRKAREPIRPYQAIRVGNRLGRLRHIVERGQLHRAAVAGHANGNLFPHPLAPAVAPPPRYNAYAPWNYPPADDIYGVGFLNNVLEPDDLRMNFWRDPGEANAFGLPSPAVAAPPMPDAAFIPAPLPIRDQPQPQHQRFLQRGEPFDMWLQSVQPLPAQQALPGRPQLPSDNIAAPLAEQLPTRERAEPGNLLVRRVGCAEFHDVALREEGQAALKGDLMQAIGGINSARRAEPSAGVAPAGDFNDLIGSARATEWQKRSENNILWVLANKRRSMEATRREQQPSGVRIAGLRAIAPEAGEKAPAEPRMQQPRGARSESRRQNRGREQLGRIGAMEDLSIDDPGIENARPRHISVADPEDVRLGRTGNARFLDDREKYAVQISEARRLNDEQQTRLEQDAARYFRMDEALKGMHSKQPPLGNAAVATKNANQSEREKPLYEARIARFQGPGRRGDELASMNFGGLASGGARANDVDVGMRDARCVCGRGCLSCYESA